MDVMLDYSIKGLFAAFYYPTNETSYNKVWISQEKNNESLSLLILSAWFETLPAMATWRQLLSWDSENSANLSSFSKDTDVVLLM